MPYMGDVSASSARTERVGGTGGASVGLDSIACSSKSHAATARSSSSRANLSCLTRSEWALRRDSGEPAAGSFSARAAILAPTVTASIPEQRGNTRALHGAWKHDQTSADPLFSCPKSFFTR